MSPTEHTLQIERVLNAPLASIWRCWTEPELLQQWFCPKPWRVTKAELELHSGGRFFTRIEGPNGEAHDLDGVLLLVEPQSRIIFTDAFRKGWLPSSRAFMTGDVSFAAEGNTTRYTAQSGAGAVKLTCSPLAGCVKLIFHACRQSGVSPTSFVWRGASSPL